MKLYELDKNYKLYLDIDGVFANFGKGVEKLLGYKHSEDQYENDPKYKKEMWRAVGKHRAAGGELWYDLELLPDAMTLWNYVKGLNPTFLSATGTSASKHTADQKMRWLSKHFGDVDAILVTAAAEKAKHAADGAILIDDKAKAIDPWEAAGGTGILHTSAASTIKQLKGLGL